eukprot:scaffold83337_cov64-Phaeocystis_antarctica.AAC.5
MLGPEGGAVLAEGLKGNSTLQVLNVRYNTITGDTADRLATVVLEHAIMTDFCGIPLTSLRENSITELNLEYAGVGVPGAIVISKLMPSAAALTSLNLDNNALCGLYYDDDDDEDDLKGTYTAEGITALCDGLKGSAITSLRCAVTPRVFAFMSAPIDTPTLSPFPILPLAHSLGGNEIGAEGASALAAILNETKITNLKCAAAPEVFAFVSAPVDTPQHPRLHPVCSQSASQPPQSRSRSRSRRGPQGQLHAAITRVGRPALEPAAKGIGAVWGSVRANVSRGADSLFSILPLACSLGHNGIGDEGASALAAILKDTQITNL